MTPAWLLDLLAAVMLVVAAISAARLVAARPWQDGSVVIDTDIAHLLMSVAMAGMLTPSLTTLPSSAWEVIFGLLTAWFAVRVALDARLAGVRALAGGHCAPHLVHSAAMLYMFLALSVSAASGMGGMGAGSGSMMTLAHPTVAFAFALVLIGYTVWDLDQLSGRRYGYRATAAAVAGAGTLRMPAAAGPASARATADSAQSLAPPGERSQAEAGHSLAGGGSAGATALLLSPAVTIGCRVTMGAVMAFMLIIAL